MIHFTFRLDSRANRQAMIVLATMQRLSYPQRTRATGSQSQTRPKKPNEDRCHDLSAELGLLKRQVRDRIRQGTEIHCGSLVPAREIDARLRRTCSIARGDGRGRGNRVLAVALASPVALSRR
jgi:hypothetical protein